MDRMLYYTITAEEFNSILNATPDVFNKMHLNILVQDVKEFKPDFIRQLSQTNTSFIFCLSPSFVNAVNDDILFSLYTVISLDNYFRYNEKNVILILPDLATDIEFIQKKLSNFFEAQGISLVIALMPTLEQSNITEQNGILFLPANIMCNESLQKDLLTRLISENDNSFLAITAMKTQLADSIQKQEQTEGKLLTIIGRILQLKADKNILLSSNQILKKRALLYYDFLGLSKKVQEKEYHDLYNWYHKEYEVLPLWYKRLGHIIKVLSGKRTFKSLFNDK